MSMLILTVCAGVTVAFIMWAIYADPDHEALEEARSRRRILRELDRIERNRKNHIIQ